MAPRTRALSPPTSPLVGDEAPGQRQAWALSPSASFTRRYPRKQPHGRDAPRGTHVSPCLVPLRGSGPFAPGARHTLGTPRQRDAPRGTHSLPRWLSPYGHSYQATTVAPAVHNVDAGLRDWTGWRGGHAERRCVRPPRCLSSRGWTRGSIPRGSLPLRDPSRVEGREFVRCIRYRWENSAAWYYSGEFLLHTKMRAEYENDLFFGECIFKLV